MDDETRCDAILAMTNYISLCDYDGTMKCLGCLTRKNRDIFAQVSYQKWAALEIVNRIQTDKSNESPLSIVLDFIDEMELYSCKASHNESFKFSTAHDTAVEIHDYLYFDWYRRANMF